MIRSEVIDQFRVANPDITAKVVTNSVLYDWCELGDKDFCARTRCIVDQDGTTISTTEDDQYYDLTSEVANFYCIDSYPGGSVTYNDKRLTQTTIAKLDSQSSNWRSRASGTPREYYVRGKYLYLDRPIDSNEEDIKVYAVLISDDWDSDVAPYNALTYLEPFHYGMLLWLTWKMKKKKGKREDATIAHQEYIEYTKWVKGELGGEKYGILQMHP